MVVTGISPWLHLQGYPRPPEVLQPSTVCSYPYNSGLMKRWCSLKQDDEVVGDLQEETGEVVVSRSGGGARSSHTEQLTEQLTQREEQLSSGRDLL